MKIAIIGAGISGLTTALSIESMSHNEHDVHIFEQAEKIRSVGAGIILAHNAMQIFEKLGVAGKLTEKANILQSTHITNNHLSILSTLNFKKYDDLLSTQSIAIHRAELLSTLLRALKKAKVHTSSLITHIDNGETKNIYFKNGNQASFDLIIGADGLNSTIRQSIFPHTKIRNANQQCWRGLAEFQLESNNRHSLLEAWGNQTRFGFVQISPNVVYWYALTSKADTQESLPHNFSDEYTGIVHTIIKNTPKENIRKDKIQDFKPLKKWHKSGICLVGDAAHATTPNLGQGACQAIESGYYLAQQLCNADIKSPLLTYEKIRMKKAHLVTNVSWNFGKIAHIKTHFLQRFRNVSLQMTPSILTEKQLEKIIFLKG